MSMKATTANVAGQTDTGPWRTLPRPTLLPPCPSWCDQDHSGDFGPDVIPVDVIAGGRPVWGLGHRRLIIVGSAEVLVYQRVNVRADGVVLNEYAPDVAWTGEDGDTRAAAAEMASALLAAVLTLTEHGARLPAVREVILGAASELST